MDWKGLSLDVWEEDWKGAGEVHAQVVMLVCGQVIYQRFLQCLLVRLEGGRDRREVYPRRRRMEPSVIIIVGQRKTRVLSAAIHEQEKKLGMASGSFLRSP